MAWTRHRRWRKKTFLSSCTLILTLFLLSSHIWVRLGWQIIELAMEMQIWLGLTRLLAWFQLHGLFCQMTVSPENKLEWGVFSKTPRGLEVIVVLTLVLTIKIIANTIWTKLRPIPVQMESVIKRDQERESVWICIYWLMEPMQMINASATDDKTRTSEFVFLHL